MSDRASAGTGPAATDAEAAPSVIVRFTESAANDDATIRTLYDVEATVGFPSVAAAYAFEDRLNDSAGDDREYLLTPDHQSDATFFLRCQGVER